MKKRSATEANVTGILFQVLVVGVLLVAVIWQVAGSVEDAGNVSLVDVSRIEQSFVTTDAVNLRRGPGMDHEIITVVPLHAELLVTGESQNGFVPVKVDGTSAWVSESFVVPEGNVFGGTTGDLTLAEVPEPPAVPPEPTVAATEAVDIPTESAVEPDPEEPPVTLAQDVPVSEPAIVESQTEPAPEQEVAAPVVASTFPEDSEPESAGEPGERWIEVDRTAATVTLHDGDIIVAEFTALLGKDPSADGFYSTATGTFHVHMKNRELTETPFAPGVYLTDFVGFDPDRSNGFHSPTRDADGNVIQTGGTSTLGCVRLGEDDARQLFDFATIGMRVDIHD